MKRKLQRIFQRKYFPFIVIMFLVAAFMGEMYYYLVENKIQTASVMLNYPGSEKGLNPDGSRFNISELKNDDLLNKAKENVNYSKYSNDFLRTRIFVDAQLPKSSVNETISSVKSGSTYTYLPAAFSIAYSQKDKFSKNEAGAFLTGLVEAYKDYFYENYTEKNTVLEYENNITKFEGYDYAEIYTILNDKINSMIIYVSSHQNENNAFRSSDGTNFGTILAELQNLRDVDLEKYQAYITQNKISKDRSAYISKLSYLRDEMQKKYDKSHGESDITKGALEKYDPSITGVAFVPSVDDSESFYMSRTKTGLDDLAKNSYNKGIEAANFSKEIDSYDNLLTKFKDAETSTDEEKTETDKMIQSITDNLSELSQKAIKVDNEYLEYKTKNYLTVKTPDPDAFFDINMILKFGVLGIILGIIIVFIIEFLLPVIQCWREELKRRIEFSENNKKAKHKRNTDMGAKI